ncbi:MAG: exosortase/archaeosortase family protein [Burkholderiales bacterium]|nr:exosortase/archaeosortase family protein [Phycisphaerae bacterium]
MYAGAIRNKITANHAVLAWCLTLLGIAVTFRAWKHIFDIAWDDPEYQHVFLVPFVAIFLAWVRRGRLPFIRVSGTVLGPLLAGIGWAAGSWGYNHQTQILFHSGAVLVVIGCIVSAVGKQALFRFIPVAIVLFLMVPMPQRVRTAVADPLQEWTASIAGYLLGIMGVNTQVSGSLLTINDRPVFIEEACNGMRMVFPLLLIAYGFAFGLPLRASVRILLVLLSPAVALLCNVMRVLPIIWLQGQGPSGQTWGERLHEHSGWIMVPLAFLVLLGCIRVLKWATIPVYRYPLASQSA